MKLLKDEITKLEALDVPSTARPDFEKFWNATRQKIAKKSMNIASKKIGHPIRGIDARDISFEGLDGTRVAAWLLRPASAGRKKIPLLVSYHGRGGSRGEPEHYAHLLMMGLGVLAMDCRLQGGITGWNGPMEESTRLL